MKLVLAGAPSSPKVSFGRNADGGHDKERGKHHDAKIGAPIV